MITECHTAENQIILTSFKCIVVSCHELVMEDIIYFIVLLDWCSRRSQQEKNTLFITIYQVSQMNFICFLMLIYEEWKRNINFVAGALRSEVNGLTIYSPKYIVKIKLYVIKTRILMMFY